MNVAAVVKESTDVTTNTHLYVSRLGLSKLNENKHPHKSGRPVFSAPIVQSFWNETEAKVKELAQSYKSRKGIQEALGPRPSRAIRIAKHILATFGAQIWNQGGNSVPFVTELDEKHYTKHLVYQDRKHKEKIRLHVLGWILQRACRRAEDTRRTLTPRKGPKRKHKSLRKSFSEIARIQTPTPSPPPSDSGDESGARAPSPGIMLVHRGDTVQPAPASQSTPNTSTVPHPPKSNPRTAVAVRIPARSSKVNRNTAMAVRKRRKKTAAKEIITGQAAQTQRRKRERPRKTQLVLNADGATHSGSSTQQAPSFPNAVSNTENPQLKRDRQDLASRVFILKVLGIAYRKN